MGIDAGIHIVRDPRGLAISISPKRWAHVADGHPEMSARFDDVVETLRNPNVIQRSTSGQNSQIYFWLKPIDYGKFSSLYLAAVVRIDIDAAVGELRTAYLVGRLGKGAVLWARRKT